MKKASSLDFRPDGIIITLSKEMFAGNGYRHWLTNFLEAMADDECTYYFRTGTQPKQEVQYLYICAGNKVRFRCNLVMTEPEGFKTFEATASKSQPDNLDGGAVTIDERVSLHGRAWLICAGPVVRPHPKEKYEMKGFRGFRYTEKLF